jgi:hypothetical protein
MRLPTSRVRAHDLRRSRVAALTTALLVTTFAAASLVASADAKRRGKPVDTQITSGPAAGSVISTATATFSFTSSVAGSTFECRIDAGSFGPCTSPFTTSALADGAHTFLVRATDPSGNVDGSPASRGFTVSTAASPPPPPPDGTTPTSWTRFASFESDLNSGSDYGWRIDSPFSVSRTSEVGGTDGSSAAKIVTNGGNSSCSCPRMTFQDGFSYGPGDEVWIGGSWYVTDPSKLAWSRLMNLGHFEGSGDPDGWYLGLLARGTGMSVQARSYSGESTSALMPARPIPSNRWFDVDLHFVFSPTDGRALTQWYTDGQLVGSTTKANMVNSTRLHFYHAGLPYFWPGNGNTTVYFDAPRLTDSTADADG